jgi:hypothetical protein
MGYYAVSSGNFLPTFGIKLILGLIIFPETSVRNYHYSLRNNPEHSFHLLCDGSLKSQNSEAVPVMIYYAYVNLDFLTLFFISYSRKETFRELDILPSSDGEDGEIEDYRSQMVASATHFQSIRN